MLSSDKSSPNYSTVIPADIAAIFGPPPVLATEPREAYEKLFIELVLEWGPSKTTEWLLVRDIADLSWEILRLRRVIASVLKISFREALADVFANVLPRRSLTPNSDTMINDFSKAAALADAWYAGPGQQEKAKSALAKYGLDAQAVVGQAFILRCDELEKMERMLAAAEIRRSAIIRMFNESRAMLPVRKNEVFDHEQVRKLPAA